MNRGTKPSLTGTNSRSARRPGRPRGCLISPVAITELPERRFAMNSSINNGAVRSGRRIALTLLAGSMIGAFGAASAGAATGAGSIRRRWAVGRGSLRGFGPHHRGRRTPAVSPLGGCGAACLRRRHGPRLRDLESGGGLPQSGDREGRTPDSEPTARGPRGDLDQGELKRRILTGMGRRAHPPP
jgi:hypothetical protein